MANFMHKSTLVGGPFTHMSGITDLEVFKINGQVYLYSASVSDGGMQSLYLQDGLVASYCDALGGNNNTGTIGVSDIALATIRGNSFLIPSGRYDDNVVLHRLGTDGDFSRKQTVTGPSGALNNYTDSEIVKVGYKFFMFSAQAGESGLVSSRIAPSMDVHFKKHIDDTPDQFLGDVSAMTSIRFGKFQYLFAASSDEPGISSFGINAFGRLTLADSIATSDGSGFSHVSELETIKFGGGRYLVMAAAGTDSISVFRVTKMGRMIETDFRQDTLDTRFDGVSALETFKVGKRAFVLAGGADDGVTLFELNPNGKLSTLATLSDQFDTTLNNVQAIAAQVFANEVQVFVTGEKEAGITQLSLDLGQLGDMINGRRGKDILTGGDGDDLIFGRAGADKLIGGAGNDRLIDGRGNDILTGGSGADVFVFHQDGQRDTITDFVKGEDLLDLSSFDMLYHISALDIQPMNWGYRIYVHDEVIRVMVENAEDAIAAPLTQDDFIF